ncbi:MAG: hypothetical protein EBT92_11200 [Planctomycetes bacterium]|nr:hypothetical protein [Planctomycetota bacterium]
MGVVKMNRKYSILVGFLTLMPICFGAATVSMMIPNTVIAADAKIRTQVTGFGKTENDAYFNARGAALTIVPKNHVWTIVENTKVTYFIGNNWICTIIIEYAL